MLEKITGLMPSEIEVLQCKVMQESPLIIQDVGQPKRQISEEFIILTRNVTNHTVKADIKNGEIDSMTNIVAQHNHSLQTLSISDCDLTIKNELKINDIILVIGFNNSQKFIIIDKVV